MLQNAWIDVRRFKVGYFIFILRICISVWSRHLFIVDRHKICFIILQRDLCDFHHTTRLWSDVGKRIVNVRELICIVQSFLDLRKG